MMVLTARVSDGFPEGHPFQADQEVKVMTVSDFEELQKSIKELIRDKKLLERRLEAMEHSKVIL
ncbi:MAG TPA: hypothetical protein PKI66_00855 [Methanobacteriaceae archaeon]|jgi:hypothetical protein|nr:hypothetical protein [Euryarchaeota archaeon]HNR25247.1 hypothetical protein [Methanobacteriaceae archaeon]HNS25963.1 hypothetical protein [Methanobacteriaceae archaeon]